MFYTFTEKKEIKDMFDSVEEELNKLRNRIELLENSNDVLLKQAVVKAKKAAVAPYGLKKDGTPRKKPGRPLKEF